MMDFDAATCAKERLEIISGLIRVRLFILRCIQWPKEPTMRGHTPAVLGGMATHNPLLDLDAEVVGPGPSEPSEPGP